MLLLPGQCGARYTGVGTVPAGAAGPGPDGTAGPVSRSPFVRRTAAGGRLWVGSGRGAPLIHTTQSTQRWVGSR